MLELILGAELVGAELAERYGLINRALPAAEIDASVDTLARRIVGLRPEVISITKGSRRDRAADSACGVRRSERGPVRGVRRWQWMKVSPGRAHGGVTGVQRCTGLI
ncbi:hypothetical protein [Streptomyces hygroscopicus]|uniref:hypothetical protein n=1 Tax=Streptomyces hygroscopicus TaxID=1912 RepID=UPI000ADB3FB3|nr:hypothetical protein [Streptomyces hygroscopicus]